MRYACSMSRARTSPGLRLRQALELAQIGVEMARETLRRRHPLATLEELDELVIAWRLSRPGAEAGDADGISGAWPRRP